MLYPSTFPHAFGHLNVGDGHQIYWEESGNPSGCPVLLLHGGPGAAPGPIARRWFDARICRIITFDQRGAGRSLPCPSIVANTTQHLLTDIETLRRHLGVDAWMLWGHSWGATLAMAYAQRYGAHVSGLVLASTFTGSVDEFEWIYGGDAGNLFPHQWSEFVSAVRGAPGRSVVHRYAHVLDSRDHDHRSSAALAWCAWEDFLAGIPPRAAQPSAVAARNRAVIGAHYARHGGFLSDREICGRLREIPPVPVYIVHGARDFLTPVQISEEIHLLRPSSQLTVVEGAGHDPSHPALMKAILAAGDAAISDTWRRRKSA